MHLGEKTIERKLQNTPNLVGIGHMFGPEICIWKDLGPMSSGAMVTQMEGDLVKSKLWVTCPKVFE